METRFSVIWFSLIAILQLIRNQSNRNATVLWIFAIMLSMQMHNISGRQCCSVSLSAREAFWSRTDKNELRETMPGDEVPPSHYLSPSRGIWVEEAATNPAQTGSILALASAMTGNSDKYACRRRRRRCRDARENAIRGFLNYTTTTNRAFLRDDDDTSTFFYIFQAVCSRDRTFTGSCSSSCVI